MSILFKLGNTDYTGHIVNASYEVNKVEVAETYKDCNGVSHFIHIRDQIKGKFDMAFQTQAEYLALATAINSAKSGTTNSWTAIVTPNNTLTQATIDCRISFEPKRELTAAGTDIIRRMTMTIEER
jgi:hypothetical protein